MLRLNIYSGTKTMRPGYKSLRRGRVSICNQIYHLTAATHNRVPLFQDLWMARAFITALHKQYQCQTLAFVVMPDHFHWLVQLNSDAITISDLVHRVKSSLTMFCRHQGSSVKIWNDGYHDRAIRREKDLLTIARYIVSNPVRAGLVKRVGDYPHWDAVWL